MISTTNTTRRLGRGLVLVAVIAAIAGRRVRTSRGTLTVTASVGVVPVLGPADLADAVRRADAAMYRAKPDRTRPAPTPYHRVVPHPQPATPRQLVDTTPGAETGGP